MHSAVHEASHYTISGSDREIGVYATLQGYFWFRLTFISWTLWTAMTSSLSLTLVGTEMQAAPESEDAAAANRQVKLI